MRDCVWVYFSVCVTCHSGTSFMKFTFIATHWQTHKLKTAKQMRESGRERGKYHVHFWLTFWFVDFILFVFGLKFWLTVALGAVGGVWNLHSTCLILFEFATVDTRHSWTNNRGGGEEREEQERITRDWEKFERICSKSKSIEFSSAIDAVTCRLALSLSCYPPLWTTFPICHIAFVLPISLQIEFVKDQRRYWPILYAAKSLVYTRDNYNNNNNNNSTTQFGVLLYLLRGRRLLVGYILVLFNRVWWKV